MNLRARSKVRIIVAVAVVAVAGFGIPASRIWIGRNEAVDRARPPAAVAFYDSKRNRIVRTDGCAKRCYTDTSVPSGWAVTRLLGPSAEPGEWLCTIASDKVANRTHFLAAIDENGMRKVPITPAADKRPWQMVSLSGNGLVMPSIRDGKLVLVHSNVEGDVIHTQIYTIPGDAVKTIRGPVDITSSGMAAAALTTEGIPHSEVYLFTSAGALRRRVGPGHCPKLSSDGTRLAYIADNGLLDVVIHDVSSGRSRDLRTWRPVKVRDLCPLGALGAPATQVEELQWDRSGRWLICAHQQLAVYGRSLVAIDLRSSHVRRYYYEKAVAPQKWCVVEDDRF